MKQKEIKLKAFTLIELIVVIAIIGILSTIIYPSFSNYLTRARDQKKLSEMKSIQNKLLEFYVTKNYYPRSLSELASSSEPVFKLSSNANTKIGQFQTNSKDDMKKYNYIAFSNYSDADSGANSDNYNSASAFLLYTALEWDGNTATTTRADCGVSITSKGKVSEKDPCFPNMYALDGGTFPSTAIPTSFRNYYDLRN